MNDEERKELRLKFEREMKRVGWDPIRDKWGSIYDWKFVKTGYTVEDGNAFRFWQMSNLTPVPW